MTGSELARKQPNDKPEVLCTRCLIAAGVLYGHEQAEWEEAEGERNE